jgi:hypothetical protein
MANTNVPNPGVYFASIAQFLTGIRDNFVNLQDQLLYINSMGGLTFLTTAFPNGLGMNATDAAALIATLNQHNTLAVQYANGPVGAQQDYRGNGAQFWGGQ